jgi:hypothetical protein
MCVELTRLQVLATHAAIATPSRMGCNGTIDEDTSVIKQALELQMYLETPRGLQNPEAQG